MPKLETYNSAGQLVSTDDTRTLEQARTEAVARVREQYAAALDAGFADPVLGVVIGSSPSDQQAFVNDLAGLAAAESAGLSVPSIAFADKSGEIHQATPADYRALLGRAWAYARLLWGGRLMAEAAAMAAANNDAADAVQFGGG